MVLQNDKQPNLTVVKQDADSNEPVADTVFFEWRGGRPQRGRNQDRAGWNGRFGENLPGVYEISEKSVPSPYLMDAEPQKAYHPLPPTRTIPYIF